MLPQTHHRGRLATLTIAILLALCFAVPSQAQLVLESRVPAPGAENVSTTQPLVLTFSQPIDTTLSFGGDEGFFIAAQVAPDPGPPLGYSLNGARTELTVNVALAANTQYWIVLIGAQSESGEGLDQPYAWTFSTGSLANSTVFGSVTFPGGTPEHAIVGLFDTNFFDSLLNDEGGDDGPQFYGLTVAGSDGSYGMGHVPAGTFLPVAFRDVNLDGEPDVSVEGEGIGFYDVDGDMIPDPIVVGAGSSVSGVDVEIHSGASTSETNYAAALDVARSAHSDAALSGAVGPDVTPEGYSPVWLYTFYSTSDDAAVDVAFFYDFLLSPEGPIFGEERPFDPTSILPDNLIGSDEAMQAAEAAGGANYRTQNAVFDVTAILLNIDLDGGAGKNQAFAEPQPIWIVTYAAADVEPLTVMVDAVTGIVIVRNESSELPASRMVLEAYPNPSAGSVSIAYELETTDNVEITVANALGQTVRHLVRGVTLAGEHMIHWDGTDDTGSNVAAGAYWLRLSAKDQVRSRMVVISH